MATPESAAFVVGLDGQITGWGHGAARLFGYTAEELVGRTVFDLVPPEGASGFPRILAAVARGETVHVTETMVGRDGTRLAVALAVTPARDGSGPVTGARAVACDVSGEHAEEARGHLRAILESIAEAVFTLDAAGVIRTWNPGAERLYGYSAHQAIGLPGASLFPARDHDEARMAFECVLAGEPVTLVEADARRQDGVAVPVSLNLWPIQDRAGAPTGVSVIARDLSDERLLLAALAQSEVRLREGESLVHAGGWVWDLSTGAVQWSEELHRIHGLAPARFGGTLEAHLEPVHPADRARVRHAMAEAVARPRALEMDYRIIRPGGEVRHLHARAEVVLAPCDTVVVTGLRGVCQDVTDRSDRRAVSGLAGDLRVILETGRRLEGAGLAPDEAAGAAEIVRHARRLLELVDDESRARSDERSGIFDLRAEP